MNDGVFVTRKTFDSVEDTLSAFYQLWMLPDMQDRANFVGYTEFDIEFEDHVSAYVMMQFIKSLGRSELCDELALMKTQKRPPAMSKESFYKNQPRKPTA